MYSMLFQKYSQRIYRIARSINIINQQHIFPCFAMFGKPECIFHILLSFLVIQLFLRPCISHANNRFGTNRQTYHFSQIPSNNFSLIIPSFLPSSPMQRNRYNDIYIPAFNKLLVQTKHFLCIKFAVNPSILILESIYRSTYRFLMQPNAPSLFIAKILFPAILTVFLFFIAHWFSTLFTTWLSDINNFFRT